MGFIAMPAIDSLYRTIQSRGGQEDDVDDDDEAEAGLVIAAL